MTAKQPKRLPVILQDLPPVYPANYSYFGPLEQRSAFEAQPAGAMSWTNAWWLADFSLLAYCGRADIDVGLIDTGFSVRPHHVVEVDALQCVIATSSEAIVVAFRGTQAPHFRQDVVFDFISPTLASGQNWLTNLETELVPFATHAGRRPGLVHAGFLDAFTKLQSGVNSALQELLAERPRPVWYAGHSLGGALATLAAAWFGNGTGLYVFGCPRVGDDKFVAEFPQCTSVWRFCNSGDPVALVPPRSNLVARVWSGAAYLHAGTAIWLDGAATPVQSVDPYEPLAIPNPRKHAPMLYSNVIWNYLASAGV